MALRSLLYIPHGSDESGAGKGEFAASDHLYIPHGSDESLAKGINLNQPTNFISHMVQMKVPFFPLFLLFPSLYIPHGSDESLQKIGKQ